MRFEHWWYTAPLRIRSIFRRGRVESELDEEIRFHLEHKVEEGIARGLSPEEARRDSLRSMGGLDQRKEEIRDARRVHWLTDFVDDVRYALRSLRRTPALSAFIVATIALGIGMTATPFSMLDALIFRPYPVPRPSEVVTLVSTSRDNAYDLFSYAEFRDLREHAQSYDGVVANGDLRTVGFSSAPGVTPVPRGGMLVSGDYFRVLGVEPRIGRGFRDDEDRVPGRDAVVVLGPGFWRNEFGGDPSVVDRTVRLNGRDFTVIGVAPESFTGLYIFDRPDFYVPLAMANAFSSGPQKNFFVDRDDRELTVRGRLKRGTKLEQARNEITLLAKAFEREHPRTNRDRGASVRTMVEMRTRDTDLNWKFSVIFTMLALAVLLVACTNAAGLLLARAGTRTREIAVRLAIGAGRSRLVRLLLTESLVLALLGGMGGVAVGYAGIAALRTFTIPAELPVEIPFRMDLRVLLASLGFSLLSAIFCGLAPALQSTRLDLVKGLKSAEGNEPAGGRRRPWGRSALVVAQIAMSMMLLAASFLMFRGFQHSVREIEFLDPVKDHLLMVRFDPRLVQYDASRTERFYELLTERLRAEPGVRSVALMQNPPLGLDSFGSLSFVPEGFVMPRDRESFTAPMDTVDEGYFETMGVPLLRGRAFLTTDTPDAPRVAIVNERLAKHYWPKGDAVGRRIRLDPRLGRARRDRRRRPDDQDRRRPRGSDRLRLPSLRAASGTEVVLMLRTNGDPLDLVRPVQDSVRILDPNMPILQTMSYAELYRYAVVDGPGVAIKLVGTLGSVALFLAIAGLYGLVAYNVSRRTREIGIRMAIGARPRDVLRLMMGKGLTLVVVGTTIGLAMGFAVERMMNAMIFNAGGTDLLVYAIVVPAMILVTMLAAYVPARKAARIAPTVALRYE